MKVKVNLSNQTLEYMDTQPYIQGTDTRNKLNVYIEHSTIPQTEGAFNIMIAYALQNGRTTIKMANTGATTETINDVLYDVFYFTAPSVLTSVAGNFVATIILKVNSNTYKVNVLNTVLNSVEFEAFEDALDDVSSEFIETIDGMAEDITQLQTGLANRVINGTNPTNISVKRINTRLNLQNNRAELEWVDDLENPTKGNGVRVKNNEVIIFQDSSSIGSFNLWLLNDGYLLGNDTTHIKKYYDDGPAITETNLELKDNKGIEGIAPIIDLYNSYAELLLDSTKARLKYGDGYIEANDNGLTIQANATDESERAKLVMTGSSSEAIKIYTDGLLALTLDTDQHAIFESDIISKSDLYFDTSYDYSLGISGNGDFNISIPNNKKLTLNGVEIPNKTYVDSTTGHYISLAIDTDFKLTAILKDANNNTISTSNVIDLPLESVVVSGSYDSTTKKVILTLENGDTIEFSVADLVSGLQTEITAQNKLSSDLVDDSNATNKFVTASEKAQITANQNVISDILDGTTIDSFADVETALATKQDTLSGSTSIDITSNVVSVKDSYVENFFATDLEVQNMLSEVFE